MPDKDTSADKLELEKALAEPFDAFSKWLSSDIDRIDPHLKEKMNEGVIADIFGETSSPIERQRSREDELRAAFGYTLMALLSSLYRLERIKNMLGHFPKKQSGISKGHHLESCTIVLLNEIYVIEERLKAFLKQCNAFETELCGSSSIHTGKTVRVYHAAFRGFLAARGGHTHRTDFEDKRIKRIQLIELLMLSQDYDFLGPTLTHAIKEARAFWLEKVDQAVSATKQVLVLAFAQVRPLCQVLFPGAVGPKNRKRKRTSK